MQASKTDGSASPATQLSGALLAREAPASAAIGHGGSGKIFGIGRVRICRKVAH